MRKIETDAQFQQGGNARKKTSRFCVRRSANNIFAAGKRFFIFAVFLAALVNFACTPRSFEKPNAAAPPSSNAEDKQASFQSELEKMRTANLQYIFVFRRKDGGAFEGEDKKYLRANLPFNNRVVLADEDKAVIVGTNYKFPPENIDALRGRFNVEDYSAAEQPK
ncbi:MAG TPA: hypothetical protein VK308_09415 [Pyrinomonadaceae bacterium]|nr:hypothetical protein [Pyrinomonadaceae bacterium]